MNTYVLPLFRLWQMMKKTTAIVITTIIAPMVAKMAGRMLLSSVSGIYNYKNITINNRNPDSS